jgi:hypothetical protein
MRSSAPASAPVATRWRLWPLPTKLQAIRQSGDVVMEPRGGNRWQSAAKIKGAQKRRKQAKSVAVGCHGLPESFHGKEGSTVRVRQRALQRACKQALLFSAFIALSPACARYGALFGALQVQNARLSIVLCGLSSRYLRSPSEGSEIAPTS